jgi:putative transporter
MIRRLDAFQSSQVVAQYQNMNEAREAIQRNEIYAFLYIPKGMTRGLGTNTQPKLSFYYSSTTLVAGSLLFKDLKTISALGSAAVGQAKLSALGRTPREIRTTLQPIAIDLHMLQNPWANYNVYLSTVMVPGLLMLFVFLLTPYSLGVEIKFQRSREWMALADNRAWVALAGKLLPQLVVSLLMFYAFEFYIYYVQDFPHSGGFLPILLCGILSLLAAQGFGIFVFGLMPGLRMAMSVCSLWAVVSLSIAGATFPVFAMSPMLEAVAQLFPLRHYYMLYQLCVLNGFPLSAAWLNLLALLLFCFLPFVSLWNIKRAMLLYTYLP